MSTEDPKPKRVKPRRASAAFGRLAEATQTNPVPGGEAAAPWRPEPVAPPAPTKPVRRFNLRLYYQADSEALDQWVSASRPHVPGKIDISRVARELLRELVEDEDLAERIRARLREEERPTRTR